MRLQEKEIRRDSLGRRISPTVLEALKATQFKPGTSGNPGGNFKRQREHAMAAVMRLLKQGKLKPSDTVADFMNLLGDMETHCEQRTLERILRASDVSLSSLIGNGSSSKKRARRPSSGETRSMSSN